MSIKTDNQANAASGNTEFSYNNANNNVAKSLDQSKDNIKRSIDESRNQIPRYTDIVNSYQEQSLQTARDLRGVYRVSKGGAQLTSVSMGAIQ